MSAGRGTNHALHLILTLLSCGLWLPIWILVAIFDTGGSTAVAVGGAGASTGPRFNRTPLIIGGVILGLVVLGQAAEHPLVFIPLFLLAGAGGVFFWKQKSAKDAKEIELREQYRRDVVAIAPITRTSCGTKAILAEPTVAIRLRQRRTEVKRLSSAPRRHPWLGGSVPSRCG